MSQVDGMLADNRSRIDSIAVNAEQATSNLTQLSNKLDTAVDDLLPKATALLDDTRASLADVREVLRTTDSKLHGLDMQQVADVLENIDTATRNLSDLSQDLKDRPYKLIRTEKPELSRFPTGAAAPAKSP